MTADQIVRSSPYYRSDFLSECGIQEDCSFPVVVCEHCDFGFTASVPDSKLLSRIYGEPTSVPESVRVFARPSRAAYAFRSLAELLEALSERVETDSRGSLLRPLQILDVGCAFGVGSTGLLRTHFPYTVTGVEWSASVRDYLRTEGMDVFSNVEDIPADRKFDGILLNDVLEHIPDPLAFLHQVDRHLAKGGVVWVNVPNFIRWRLNAVAVLVNNGSFEVPTDMNPLEHLSYFSPASLSLAMDRVGYRRVRQDIVDYRLRANSIPEALKTVVRVARDCWRIFKATYSNSVSTQGIFIRQMEDAELSR